MTRLDWEKAKERERAGEAKASSRPGPSSAKRRATAEMARTAFVEKHGISCFKCGATKAEWAKTGISKRGAWAICVDCVQKGRDG